MEQVTIGTLSNLVIDSFEHKIDIRKHIWDLKNLSDDCLYQGFNVDIVVFFFKWRFCFMCLYT